MRECHTCKHLNKERNSGSMFGFCNNPNGDTSTMSKGFADIVGKRCWEPNGNALHYYNVYANGGVITIATEGKVTKEDLEEKWIKTVRESFIRTSLINILIPSTKEEYEEVIRKEKEKI